MTFSFVIPVYQTERHLPRCLDSLVAQTDGDFEAIVVDDGSDGTAEGIVARYDARFRYLRHASNRSTFQAKITGLSAAKGDYVVPLDSDDDVLPDLVARLRAAASVASPDVIVYPMLQVRRGRTTPVKYNHPRGTCSGEEALRKLFDGRLFMPVCGKAIRRAVFRKAHAALGVGADFYLNFTDDLCWLVPILLHARTVAFITGSGYRYRQRDDSMTRGELTPERLRSLAEQSQRSVETVGACARRLGCGDETLRAIRAQLYPTIRWLLRDRRVPRAAVEAAFGAACVGETLRWDAARGNLIVRAVRHLVKYGFRATVREFLER